MNKGPIACLLLLSGTSLSAAPPAPAQIDVVELANAIRAVKGVPGRYCIYRKRTRTGFESWEPNWKPTLTPSPEGQQFVFKMAGQIPEQFTSRRLTREESRRLAAAGYRFFNHWQFGGNWGCAVLMDLNLPVVRDDQAVVILSFQMRNDAQSATSWLYLRKENGRWVVRGETAGFIIIVA